MLYGTHVQGCACSNRSRSTDSESAKEASASLARDLRKALRNDELTVYYQPIVNLRSGRVVAMEALLRWRHPELNLVLPNAFIPVAEKAGLITRVSALFLERACEDALTWPEHIRVAINLAPADFLQQDLSDTIRKVLNKTGLTPSRLELEIGERSPLSLDAEAKTRLDALASLGVRLSLDDFGTGFSDLNHLSFFPVTTVKIDKMFSSVALSRRRLRPSG